MHVGIFQLRNLGSCYNQIKCLIGYEFMFEDVTVVIIHFTGFFDALRSSQVSRLVGTSVLEVLVE
jgi:hypothetical protein